MRKEVLLARLGGFRVSADASAVAGALGLWALLAARSTGYPMTGLRFWTVLSASVYPADEPALPARVHLRRALGGPLASALLTVALGLLWRATPPAQHRRHALARFAFWENLLVFTLGALLPLGFTDGSTIRRVLRDG